MCIFGGKALFLKIGAFGLIGAAASTDCMGQGTLSAGGGRNSTVSSPFKRESYPYVAPVNATSPFFSHGYLIQFTHDVASAASPSIYLYNSSGILEQKVTVWPETVWPEQASKLVLASVDVGKNRQLAFSGRRANSEGGWQYFVAVADITGARAQYFDTGRYLANEIAVADDGSIWTVGAEKERPSIGGPRVWDNYDVLRQFSPEGKLLQQFLPRWGAEASYAVENVNASGTGDSRTSGGTGSTVTSYAGNGRLLATYTAPLWGSQPAYTHASSIFSQAWLRASGDGVVLYDGKVGVLHRYSSSSHSLSSQSVDLSGNAEKVVTGFAVLSDGRILATRQASSRTHPSNAGLEELVVAASGDHAEWTSVRSDDSGGTPTHEHMTALGADGTAIVFRSVTKEVAWAQVN